MKYGNYPLVTPSWDIVFRRLGRSKVGSKDCLLVRGVMPAYELFCLARPGLPLKSLAAVIEKSGKAVFANSGVLTDIQSFGDRELAYPIRKAGNRFAEVTTVIHTRPLFFESCFGGTVLSVIPRSVIGVYRLRCGR